MAAGPPEADTGARWPRSCAAASGTPCALARGHRGPGNGIKHRETDGDSVTGRGNKEGIERRQEKSFSGWSENYLLGGGGAAATAADSHPPHPGSGASPSRGAPAPRGSRCTRLRVGKRGRLGSVLTQLGGPPFAPPPAPRLSPLLPARPGEGGERAVDGNSPGKILGAGGTETLRAKSWHPGLGTPGLRAERSC